jgi:hypothetical protein
VWREPGLNGVLAFGKRMSGLYMRNPLSGSWELLSVALEPAPHATDAMRLPTVEGEVL